LWPCLLSHLLAVFLLKWGATQASESDTRAGDLHYVLSKQEQSTAASTSSASSASSLTTVHHDGDPATQVSHASFADSLASAASTRHRSSADASVEGEDNGELPLAPPLFKIKPMRVLPPPPEGYHRKRQRKDDASPESPLATAADPSATSSSSSAPPTTSSSSSDPSSSSSSGLNPAENAAKSLDLSGLQEQFMCGICDEVMVDAWSFGCNGGHANCKQCVLPWVKQHATCPQCQSKVSLPGNRNVPVDQIIEAAVIAEVVDPEEATRYWSRRGLPAPARASSSSGPPLTLAATQGVRADSAETHAPDSAPAPSQPAVAPIFTSKRNKNRSRGSTGSSERTSSKVIDVDNNSSFNDAEVSNKLAFVAFVAFVALNLPSNVA